LRACGTQTRYVPCINDFDCRGRNECEDRLRSARPKTRLVTVKDRHRHCNPIGVRRATVVAPATAETVAAVHFYGPHAKSWSGGDQSCPVAQHAGGAAFGK